MSGRAAGRAQSYSVQEPRCYVPVSVAVAALQAKTPSCEECYSMQTDKNDRSCIYRVTAL